MNLQAIFKIATVTDTLVLILDQDGPRSVTNDAQGVIDRLAAELGGLGLRRIFYRDTMGRFDELKVEQGRFVGFAPCSPHQQEAFLCWCEEA
jgi:hypothetical protein